MDQFTCHYTTADHVDAPDGAGMEADDPPAEGSGGSMGVDIELTFEAGNCTPPFDGWALPLLTAVVRTLGWSAANLSVALVGDEQMAELHQRYKQTTGTTDVLTFDLREPADMEGEAPFAVPLEAELVLCVDEAARQAARLGHETRQELLLYAIHGLLHLAGYDDHEPEAAAAMHRREDELLESLGLPAVYHHDDDEDVA